MSVRFAIIGILTCIVIGLAATLSSPAETGIPHESPESMDTVDAKQHWQKQIRERGGEAAYRFFVSWASSAGIGRQHLLAHIMGGLLYEELGERGLTICDSSFSFGCFHEFLGRAIHEGGLPVVAGLNEACVTHLGPQALSCQHGIGHGIQTYLGYDEAALQRSLAECRDLPYNDPIGGCYGGVFMEYNMRTMLSLDGVGPREAVDPAHPCSALETEYLPACYYWQPQWWVATRQGSLEDAYRQMGEWCAATGTRALERYCFEGIGNISGQTAGYNPARTIELCEIAADGDPTAALYCRADAANSYHASQTAQEDAIRVCEGLEGGEYEYCRKYSDNTFNQVVAAPAVE